jgi:hypothetical protein
MTCFVTFGGRVLGGGASSVGWGVGVAVGLVVGVGVDRCDVDGAAWWTLGD